MSDLLTVEAWVFITVSVAGLLLHLPHYFPNKIWWAFRKNIEKPETRNIAQYNSWFSEIPNWVPTAKSLTCLELHSNVLCCFNEEDCRQRGEGYLSPNHAQVPESLGSVEAANAGFWCAPWVTQCLPYLVPCCPHFPRGPLSFPFPSISLRAGRWGSVELKRRRKCYFYAFSF